MEYFTVTAEKATRHIPDNNIRNRPHSGTAQQSRIISINLKVGTEYHVINYIWFTLFVNIFFLFLAITTPFYVLVETYAGVQFILHMMKYIFRSVTLSLSLLFTTLIPTVLS
jgi:hypothetical protein